MNSTIHMSPSQSFSFPLATNFPDWQDLHCPNKKSIAINWVAFTWSWRNLHCMNWWVFHDELERWEWKMGSGGTGRWKWKGRDGEGWKGVGGKVETFHLFPFPRLISSPHQRWEPESSPDKLSDEFIKWRESLQVQGNRMDLTSSSLKIIPQSRAAVVKMTFQFEDNQSVPEDWLRNCKNCAL